MLKWLPKAACPPTYVLWLGTLYLCQTVTSHSQDPQLLSHSFLAPLPLLFPLGDTSSLPIPVKVWGALGA